MHSQNGETPLHIAVEKEIISLLRFVSDSFKKVQLHNHSVLSDLRKDIDLAKIVLRAKNRGDRTLIEFAILSDFPETKQLKELFQDIRLEIIARIFVAEKFEESFSVYEKVLHERIEIFGSDNPSVLDIQTCMAQILFKELKYDESLCMLQVVYQKRQIYFSDTHKEILFIKSIIASILSLQGNNQEGLSILRQVLSKQEAILEPNDEYILFTQTEIAVALAKAKKYSESLKILFKILEKYKKEYGPDHSILLEFELGIGNVLKLQGNFSDAIKYFKEVYEKRKKELGPENPHTLQVKVDIANILYEQHNSFEFYDVIERVLRKQKRSFNPNHPYILQNEVKLADILYMEGRHVSALKYFLTLEKKTAFLGSKHFLFKNCRQRIDCISAFFKDLGGERGVDVLQVFEGGNASFHVAAAQGQSATADIIMRHCQDRHRRTLQNVVNATNDEGSTPLHVAVDVKTVKCLLKRGVLYDAKIKANRTPLDLCKAEEIRSLLETVEDLFNSVQNGKCDDVVGKIEALDAAASCTSDESEKFR
ncbi:uncharacterized protein CDAR_532851 [Caerostris darwini]|uniref:Uncharacterized protein n=1 Tax=Caerostris darwini TaxID=1538125 RepID=A0AAV4WN05_9ARAC|nr:uncharacterized protein CDAR_532851 [Caerostris darwini]